MLLNTYSKSSETQAQKSRWEIHKLRRNNNCASASAILQGSYALAIRIHVRRHACVRGSHGDRPQPRGREVHRTNVRRGASVDRHPSRPTVRRRSPSRQREEGESTCLGVFILCMFILACEHQLRDISHWARFRGARISLHAIRAKSLIAEGGSRGCFWISLSLSFFPYECELPWVTVKFEESYPVVEK